MHRDSEIQAILLCGVTSIHSLPANIRVLIRFSGIIYAFCVKAESRPRLTHTDHWAALLALLTAFLRFTFVMVDNGNPGVFICHYGELE